MHAPSTKESSDMSHPKSNIRLNTLDNIFTLDPTAFVIREHGFLFRTGDKLDGVYRVNSGSVKIYRTSEDGELQIIGFYMQGDLIGLDALVDGVSRSTAEIMEISNISLIPFETILSNGKDFDYLTFIHKLGESYNRERDHSIVLSQCTSRRLAWFLVEYSDAMSRSGHSAAEFILPMNRTDIALFLGMAVETLSRMFAGLRKSGLIKVNRRHVQLLDIDSLRKIASVNETAEKSACFIGFIKH